MKKDLLIGSLSYHPSLKSTTKPIITQQKGRLPKLQASSENNEKAERSNLQDKRKTRAHKLNLGDLKGTADGKKSFQ